MRLAAVLSLSIVLIAVAPSRAAYPYALQHHPTSTKSAAAQLCFDRGLTLFYAYNRLASQRAFECAAKTDPTFALAYWGIALAHGTNINVSIDAAGEKAAYAAMQRAIALQAQASSPERAYIHALATRYSNSAHLDLQALARSYSHAAGELAAQYPDDPDAAVLFAESMMELRPWQWYTPAGAPVGETTTIMTTLESVLLREPSHLGANHFCIHALEASQHPQRALICANRLRGMTFEPGAAHLVHMPAHIYMRTGDYALAAEVNEHASMHDITYLHGTVERDTEFVWSYHDHNLSMLAAAYADAGSWTNAQHVATMLTNEGALVPAMFVYLRFGRWHDILAMKPPRADSEEPIRIPMWHFTRGMALAGSAEPLSAAAELAALQAAQRSLRIRAWPGTYNSSADILGIAVDVLSAKIAQAQGDRVSQISHLRSAVSRQDNLLYIEPPDWYAPVRESLGSALFAAGDYSAAVSVFRDDLARNYRNPRSLFGLCQSLKAQHDDADAAWVQRQFNAAWQKADVPLAMDDL